MGNPYKGWDAQIDYLNNHPDFNLAIISDLKEKMIWQKKNCDEFIKIIIKTSKKYPNYNIIVRPHPSENESFYNNNKL